MNPPYTPAANKPHQALRCSLGDLVGVPSGGAMTSGRIRIITDIVNMVPRRIGLRKRLGITDAVRAPTMPPMIVGIRIGIMAGRSRVSYLS